MKKLLGHALLAASVAAATFGALNVSANAYTVCNGRECWHSDNRIVRPGVHFTYHPDDWYFHQTWNGGPYSWHDRHEGRGYWRNGVWIRF